MQRVSLEIYTAAYEALKILENVADHKVELDLPVGSVLLDNILNLKLIAEGAKKLGKSVDFVTADPFGQNLIKILRGETDQVVVREEQAVEVVGMSGGAMTASNSINSTVARPKLAIPAIKLPEFALGRLVGKAKLVVPILLLVLLGGGFLYLSRTHTAKVVLHFTKETSTKSVQVKVGDGLKTDLDKKVLAGLKLTKTIDETAELSSTGTKLEGEKAEGGIKLYNYLAEAVTVKKGTKLTYKNNDTSYVFLTDTEVTIPKRTASDPTPDIVITPGSVTVEVTAENIGADYNLKKDKELDVKGYDSDEVSAKSAENFSGGSSKEVAVVAQVDITKLEQELAGLVSTNAGDGLKNAVPAGYSMIEKSAKVTSKNTIINAKVGDEKAKLAGSISAQIEGLAYSKNELVEFMGKLSEGLVPPGFEYYSYNKDLQVEVLGETENTVLTPTEADLQVTFRFFVVPKIDKTMVFQSIEGKNLLESKDVLEKINGVEQAEISISHNFPLFNRVPTRQSAVEIETKVKE